VVVMSLGIYWRLSAVSLLVAIGLGISQSQATERAGSGRSMLLVQSNTQSDVTNPNLQDLFLPGSESDVTNPNFQEITVPEGQPSIDRSSAFESNPETALIALEEYQALELAKYFGFKLYGAAASPQQIANRLGQLAKKTGQRTAVIYAFSGRKGLELLMVLPSSTVAQRPMHLADRRMTPDAIPSSTNQPWLIRKQVPSAKRAELQRIARTFRTETSDPRKLDTTSYLASSKQLYAWLVAPLSADLQTNQIDTLVFCLDNGLRSLPLAALNDGQNFLVEKYNLALIPSFSLTDTSYTRLKTSLPMLGMGISESTEGQAALPAVAVEVPTLTQKIWRGEAVLNQDSTLANLETLTRSGRFRILHLATHAEFKRGNVNNSYIQLWNSRLRLGDLRQVSLASSWSPQIELLVLSACQTALGDTQAELGFAGLAVQSGVKTALGSLWQVRDEASLGLMTGFYQQLEVSSTRSAALRQTQLAMLKGEIRVEEGQLRLSDQTLVALPPALAKVNQLNFSHPYFWSAFQIVGNWN
jgi:CHAT domain-containing protein